MEILSLDPETGITYKMIQGVPFVNCTPHPIHIYVTPDAKLPITIPASGFMVRSTQTIIAQDEVAGIPLFSLQYDSDDGTQPGDFPVCKPWVGNFQRVVYIVSLRFIQALGDDYRDYPILYTPGSAKRAADGTQVGCVGLCMQVHDDHDAYGPMSVLQPDWSEAPYWATYFAVDADNVACWYEFKPTANTESEDTGGYWEAPAHCKVKRHRYGHYGIPWQLTLRERPQEGKE